MEVDRLIWAAAQCHRLSRVEEEAVICKCLQAATAVARCVEDHLLSVRIKVHLRESLHQISTCIAATISMEVVPETVMTSLAWAMAREATVTEEAAEEISKVVAGMIVMVDEMAVATTEIEMITTEEVEAVVLPQPMKVVNITTTIEIGETEEMKVDINRQMQEVTTTREIDLLLVITTESRVYPNFNQT